MHRVKQRLTAVLHNEVRIGMVMHNVAEVSQLPPNDVEPNQRRSLTLAELHRILDSADRAVGDLIDLYGRTGLRPAEARALGWQDVCLDSGELQITGQMDQANTRGPVKRAATASRAIAMDRTTVERLTSWKLDQADMAAMADRHGSTPTLSLPVPLGMR